jgi:hypothetical protein
MVTTHTPPAPVLTTNETRVQHWLHDPAYQAFWLLRIGFSSLLCSSGSTSTSTG